MAALRRHPRSRRSSGVTLYALAAEAHQDTRQLRYRLKRLRLATHAHPGGAALAPTDDDADVAVYLTDTEDDGPQQAATLSTPNGAQRFIHGGRNIPLPPAVDHASVHHSQQQPGAQAPARPTPQ
ncbi:hypothetical protein ACSSS7_006693 [Eimeria intestinalis]